MNPFYFGRSERRLFGIYDAPAIPNAAKRAAILCYPWGPEYLHAHRTMRQLALKLSAAGFHTLRFDYFGTGDSGGEPTDVDLEGCEADLETAIEEIKDIAGTTRITLIGLRLGASIAASVAARPSCRIDSLVLWDVVISGAQYLQQLGVPPNAEPPFEALGCPLSSTLLRDLRMWELSLEVVVNLPLTLVLLTERLPSHGVLAPRYGDSNMAAHTIEFREDVRPWLETIANKGLVPFTAIQRIVTWLE